MRSDFSLKICYTIFENIMCTFELSVEQQTDLVLELFYMPCTFKFLEL